MFPVGRNHTCLFEVVRVHGFIPFIFPAVAARHAARHKEETTKRPALMLEGLELRSRFGVILTISTCRRHGGNTLNFFIP